MSIVSVCRSAQWQIQIFRNPCPELCLDPARSLGGQSIECTDRTFHSSKALSIEMHFAPSLSWLGHSLEGPILQPQRRSPLLINTTHITSRCNRCTTHIHSTHRCRSRHFFSLQLTHSIGRLAFFDQFPYTNHVECGVWLQRRSRATRGDF